MVVHLDVAPAAAPPLVLQLPTKVQHWPCARGNKQRAPPPPPPSHRHRHHHHRASHRPPPHGFARDPPCSTPRAHGTGSAGTAAWCTHVICSRAFALPGGWAPAPPRRPNRCKSPLSPPPHTHTHTHARGRPAHHTARRWRPRLRTRAAAAPSGTLPAAPPAPAPRSPRRPLLPPAPGRRARAPAGPSTAGRAAAPPPAAARRRWGAWAGCGWTPGCWGCVGRTRQVQGSECVEARLVMVQVRVAGGKDESGDGVRRGSPVARPVALLPAQAARAGPLRHAPGPRTHVEHRSGSTTAQRHACASLASPSVPPSSTTQCAALTCGAAKPYTACRCSKSCCSWSCAASLASSSKPQSPLSSSPDAAVAPLLLLSCSKPLRRLLSRSPLPAAAVPCCCCSLASTCVRARAGGVRGGPAAPLRRRARCAAKVCCSPGGPARGR